MDFNKDFIPLALRTESNIPPLTFNPAVLSIVMNAAIAVGTLVDLIKKNVAYNKPINLNDWNDSVSGIRILTQALSNVEDYSFFQSNDGSSINLNTRLFHGIFGLFTESTELMEALSIAKDTGVWDFTNIKEEIFDSQWYNSVVLDEIGADMDDILKMGIQKLQARYPNKYSDDNAINRNLVIERKILES